VALRGMHMGNKTLSSG